MSWSVSFDALTLGMVGLKVRGRRYYPCPACGADRHGKDKRAPVFAVKGGLGWKCYSCDEQGTALHALMLGMFGTKIAAGDHRWREVMQWMESRHLVRQEVKPYVEPPPVYAPVREALQMCRRPDCDDWLSSRGLTRDVPAGMLPPGWSADWWPWADRFPLVVPAFDIGGTLRSMHGRAVDPNAPRKTTWPLKTSVRGLLMANRSARSVLRSKTAPDSYLIVEGLTDYLTVGASDVPVLGVASGVDLSKLPLSPNTIVAVATDPDAAGDRYAQRIASQLNPHPVRRVLCPRT